VENKKLRDALVKKKSIWRDIAPTLFWWQGIKLLSPFSFLYKEVKRKLSIWVGKS